MLHTENNHSNPFNLIHLMGNETNVKMKHDIDSLLCIYHEHRTMATFFCEYIRIYNIVMYTVCDAAIELTIQFDSV